MPPLPNPRGAPPPPIHLKATLGCLLGTLLGSNFLTVSAVGIVMATMTSELGWSRAGISGAITVMLMLGAIMTALWGRLIDRVGIRWIVVVGTVFVGLFTLSLTVTTHSLPQFYAVFAGLGFAGSTAVGYTKAIGVMFTRNRGKALALFGMESTLVGAISPQIIFQLEKHFGWRGMFLDLGLLMIAVAITLIFLLDAPVLRVKPAPRAGAPRDVSLMPGVTASVALRSPNFWLVNVASMTGNITATGLLPHLVPLALSRGLSPQAAVTALTVHTLAIPCGQFCGGVLLDRVDTARIAVPFAVIALAGLLILSSTHGGPLGVAVLLGGVGMLGFGNGAKRSMNTYFFTRYYGLRALAELSGLSLAISSLVLAPAPLVFGLIFDRTHSYDGALWVLGIGLVIANLLYLFLGPYRFPADVGAAPLPSEPMDPVTGGAVV